MIYVSLVEHPDVKPVPCCSIALEPNNEAAASGGGVDSRNVNLY
jgi:hypothetical protein